MKIIIKALLIVNIVIFSGFGNYSLATINKVKVDFAQGVIIINGENIAYPITETIRVSLGEYNLEVCETCYSETEITAEIPAGLADGYYKLKISVYGQANLDGISKLLYHEYNLTVVSAVSHQLFFCTILRQL